MPCWCGDSQCPSCGAAQSTLDPRAHGYVFKVRYVEPDCNVDDHGRKSYTGNVLRLIMLDAATLDEVESIDFMLSEVLDMVREVEFWDTEDERLTEGERLKAELERLSLGLLKRSPDNNPAMSGSVVDSALAWIDALLAEVKRLRADKDEDDPTYGAEHAARDSRYRS